MKQKLLITIILLMSICSFSQKKELKGVEKALRNENFAEAKAKLAQLETIISTAEAKYKEKYYFLLGKAYYANGAGKNEDFELVNTSFQNVGSSYQKEVDEIKAGILLTVVDRANKAYSSKDYKQSSKSFEQAYKLSLTDTIYLYYAASASVNAQDFNTALNHYNALRNLGYKGVRMEYYAINKASGSEEYFNDKQIRDFSVKAGTHEKPRDKKTKSVAAEIVKNIALIYVQNEENEKALEAMSAARSANPDDANLLLSHANVYYKMGNIEQFERLMNEAADKDPNNPDLQYNLGVLAYDAGKLEAARAYYQKTIDLQKDYQKAYINMAAAILDEEKAILEEMNNLGSSSADNRRYDELMSEREEVFKSAIPYLSTALEFDSNNLAATRSLMEIYSAIGDMENYKVYKAKAETIEQQEQD